MFGSAIKYVRKIRPNICPNLGFELQLKKYQDTLGLGEVKKQKGERKEEVEEKKRAKEMLLTFNMPINYNQSARSSIANTKPVVKPSPNLNRKSHSNYKKQDKGVPDLFIYGKPAGLDTKNQSMYDPMKYSTKNGMMESWGSRQKKEGFKL